MNRSSSLWTGWSMQEIGHIINKTCWYWVYRKTSNIRRPLLGNRIVDHSDVVGASPAGAAQTTSSFSVQCPTSNWLGQVNCKTPEKRNILSLGFGASYIRDLTVYVVTHSYICYAVHSTFWTSSWLSWQHENGSVLCITGPLWEEPPVAGGCPSQRASYTELRCFLRFLPAQTVGQRVNYLGTWDTMTPIWRHNKISRLLDFIRCDLVTLHGPFFHHNGLSYIHHHVIISTITGWFNVNKYHAKKKKWYHWNQKSNISVVKILANMKSSLKKKKRIGHTQVT